MDDCGSTAKTIAKCRVEIQMRTQFNSPMNLNIAIVTLALIDFVGAAAASFLPVWATGILLAINGIAVLYLSAMKAR
jgi:hypothetical protein